MSGILDGKRVGFAMTGSFCTFSQVFPAARALAERGAALYPIVSDNVWSLDTRFYSADEVRAMVRKEQEVYGWEFLFLGANIDAVQTAARFGIGEERSVNFVNDSEGQALNYGTISDAVASVRQSRPLTREWKKNIEDDFNRRSHR